MTIMNNWSEETIFRILYILFGLQVGLISAGFLLEKMFNNKNLTRTIYFFMVLNVIAMMFFLGKIQF